VDKRLSTVLRVGKRLIPVTPFCGTGEERRFIQSKAMKEEEQVIWCSDKRKEESVGQT
jgi:hypothetical protein